MNRSVALAALASIAVVTATPALSQGRFGSETAQKAADRIEREAIRKAEHPELYPPAAGQPAQAAASQAPVEAAPPSEPAAVTEPAPAAAAAQ